MLHCWCQNPLNQFHFYVAIVLWRRNVRIVRFCGPLVYIQYSGCGLLGYLIRFATHTLVIQCQSKNRVMLSLSMFQPISIDFILPLVIPLTLLFRLKLLISFPYQDGCLGHLITLNAYSLFKTQSHLCYRGCWHRFGRDP